MSIHVTIGYRDGFADRGQPFVPVIDKKFELSQDAVAWWKLTGFNDGSGSVQEVLIAAKDEYVGTEHELMTPDAHTHKPQGNEGGYTRLWCCIEGQEGKDTFDERYKDMVVDEIVFLSNSKDVQLNGKDLNGKRVWMTLHLHDNMKLRTALS